MGRPVAGGYVTYSKEQVVPLSAFRELQDLYRGTVVCFLMGLLVFGLAVLAQLSRNKERVINR